MQCSIQEILSCVNAKGLPIADAHIRVTLRIYIYIYTHSSPSKYSIFSLTVASLAGFSAEGRNYFRLSLVCSHLCNLLLALELI